MIPWILALGLAVAAPLSADEAVSQALNVSIAVAEADADLERSRGRVRAAGFLRHDPQVGASWAAVGDQVQLSVSQRVSLTGEGVAERRSGRAALEAGEDHLQRTRFEVAAEVRVLWAEAVEAQQHVLLAERASRLATQLRNGAERRLETGEGALLDARLARVEEAEAVAVWMSAVVAEGAALAKLSAATGRPLNDIELPDDPLRATGSASSGESARSDLAAAHHGIDAAQAALSRERSGTVPPVALGAFYEEEGPERRIGPSVKMTLPLWRRNADGRADAKAGVREAEARLNALEVRAAAERDSTSAVLLKLSEVENTQQNVQEEAQAALESIGMGYGGGELDLLTAALLRSEILDGQRAWLEGRRILAAARVDRMLATEDPLLLGSATPALDK